MSATLDLIAAALTRLAIIEKRLDELQDGVRNGWKEIATGLRCSERTAREWAKRAIDPLPVDKGPGGEATIPESRLRDWANRNTIPYQHAREVEQLRKEVRGLRRQLEAAPVEAEPSETAREITTGPVRRRPAKLPPPAA